MSCTTRLWWAPKRSRSRRSRRSSWTVSPPGETPTEAKLAVVAEDDERLHVVLENLGLLPYFDFVLTSRETGFELSDTGMYELAMETAGVKHAHKVRVLQRDSVKWSCEAGMEAVRAKRVQSMCMSAQTNPTNTTACTRSESCSTGSGLPEAVEEYMGRRRESSGKRRKTRDDEDYLDDFYTGDEDIQLYE
ncbi:unnamed protein product [Pylaiella littoralis]